MKKVFFTLAVFVMAFGNMSFAQRIANIKSNEMEIVFRHYGLRNDDMKPAEAICKTTDVDEMTRYSYTYDEYDYYLSQMLIEMDYGYGWMPASMVSCEYDFYGNVLEMLGLEWEDGDWEEMAKASYTYTTDGMEVIYQFYEDGTWFNSFKEVYNYNGDVTTVLLWDWNGSHWSSSELHTYTYSDTSIEVLMQYMQGGAWQNDDKDLYTLDFSGNVLEKLCQDWENNAWVNDERTTYNFENEVYVSMLVEDWSNGTWQAEYRYDFVYDNGNAVHGECMESMGGQWVPGDGDIEMAYNFNAASDTYYGHEVDVTYIDVTALEENVQTTNFKVYPVPAESEIQIQAKDFQKAEIYSVTGQKVMESMTKSINVNPLEAGVYLLKVYGIDGNSETQRIVVR